MEQSAETAIQLGHRIALLVLSLMLLGFVLELVRRDLLKERYALLWLATSLFGLVVGVFPNLIFRFASLVRFQMLTALFVLSFMFMLAIVLGFSVVISKLSERNRVLAQEIGLLANRLEQLEGDQDERDPEDTA